MKSVYLAGPITGVSYDGTTSWRNLVTASLEAHGIAGLSPMRFKKHLKAETAIGNCDESNPMGSAKGITTRDRFDVMRSDVILFNLLDAKIVSIGTMIEVGWGDMLRKPMVVAMEPDNIHKHAMLRETVGYIVPTLQEAVNLTVSILSTRGE
jgi:nucleoside 2-deoxyribosyltransferase